MWCKLLPTTIAISIGFELSSYTYNEPMFETQINENFSSPNNLLAYGPVYFIKENNMTSEQMFRIVVSVEMPEESYLDTATPDVDYEIRGGGTFTISFPPTQQRLNVEFTLFPDDIPESTEAFTISFSRADMFEVDGRVFTLSNYLFPWIASASINILDDDR